MSPVTIDPENNAVRYIQRYARLENRRALDIGCGDGKLTCRYAGGVTHLEAVDPAFSELRTAVTERPTELEQRVQFAAARAEALPFPNQHFDLAIFTFSL